MCTQINADHVELLDLSAAPYTIYNDPILADPG